MMLAGLWHKVRVSDRVMSESCQLLVVWGMMLPVSAPFQFHYSMKWIDYQYRYTAMSAYEQQTKK